MFAMMCGNYEEIQGGQCKREDMGERIEYGTRATSWKMEWPSYTYQTAYRTPTMCTSYPIARRNSNVDSPSTVWSLHAPHAARPNGGSVVHDKACKSCQRRCGTCCSSSFAYIGPSCKAHVIAMRPAFTRPDTPTDSRRYSLQHKVLEYFRNWP